MLVDGTPCELPFTGHFLPGSTVTVDPVPNTRLEFDQWSGDYPAGGRFSDPLQIVMDDDCTIDPHFRRASRTAQLTSMNAQPTGQGRRVPCGTYLVRVTAFSSDGGRSERLVTMQVR